MNWGGRATAHSGLVPGRTPSKWPRCRSFPAAKRAKRDCLSTAQPSACDVRLRLLAGPAPHAKGRPSARRRLASRQTIRAAWEGPHEEAPAARLPTTAGLCGNDHIRPRAIHHQAPVPSQGILANLEKSDKHQRRAAPAAPRAPTGSRPRRAAAPCTANLPDDCTALQQMVALTTAPWAPCPRPRAHA